MAQLTELTVESASTVGRASWTLRISRRAPGRLTPHVIGLILIIAAGFVIGWVIDHPAAWAVVLIPVAFALMAGGDVDIVVAILGIALTALAVLAGRAVARRRPPPDEGDERDEADEADEGDERDERSG